MNKSGSDFVFAYDPGKVGGDKTVEVYGHFEGDVLVIDRVVELES